MTFPYTYFFLPKTKLVTQVTLAVLLGGRGQITKTLALKYILAQLLAAAVAGMASCRWTFFFFFFRLEAGENRA